MLFILLLVSYRRFQWGFGQRIRAMLEEKEHKLHHDVEEAESIESMRLGDSKKINKPETVSGNNDAKPSPASASDEDGSEDPSVAVMLPDSESRDKTPADDSKAAVAQSDPADTEKEDTAKATSEHTIEAPAEPEGLQKTPAENSKGKRTDVTDTASTPEEGLLEKTEQSADSKEDTPDTPKVTSDKETDKELESSPEPEKAPHRKKGKHTEDGMEEIEESNAEDAEDADNQHRHHISFLDYHSMPMENLVGELQRLVRNEKVQAIKKHVDSIKYEFDQKFQEFIEHKKEEFIDKGGNEIDFKYNSVTKRQFNEVYSDYREKRNVYYKNLDHDLKANLALRLEIIEELKGLVNVEEDINTTYRNFKDIQERWRHAGPIPRNSYNDVWRTYEHHIEIFYDFLHLNRELRDLDFKHNLDEKLKLIERAEALVEEPDLNKAFRELQSLHKLWKEDIGPVGKEHRDEIWEKFSIPTKALHQRRQDYYKDLDKAYEVNLANKNEIIAGIREISSHVASSHKALQKQIKDIEALRERFFKAGKVPQQANEKTWASFKEAVRDFNRNKNAYYKNLKHAQQDNLEKKRELLKYAISLQDSEEWESTTAEMKRIQGEWKNIGHVPRKYSDKIWNDFKNACNHYFNRFHATKNKASNAEHENFEKKNACLDKLKSIQLSGDKKKDLANIKSLIEEWRSHGRVPFNKKNINARFNKILDALFRKLDVGRQESELLKYGNKIQQLANTDNEHAITDERTFIRRKIDESKSEIRQLENNLQFFSNASEDSPLVKEVVQNIDRQKETLATWKAKLKKLNILENNLSKAAEEGNEDTDPGQEEE